jgi:hypothetical protein
MADDLDKSLKNYLILLNIYLCLRSLTFFLAYEKLYQNIIDTNFKLWYKIKYANLFEAYEKTDRKTFWVFVKFIFDFYGNNGNSTAYQYRKTQPVNIKFRHCVNRRLVDYEFKNTKMNLNLIMWLTAIFSITAFILVFLATKDR